MKIEIKIENHKTFIKIFYISLLHDRRKCIITGHKKTLMQFAIDGSDRQASR